MKRKNFEVLLDGKRVALRHAFNTAANDGVLDYLRTRSRAEGQTYSRVAGAIDRASMTGTRVWRGDRTGEELCFIIQQIGSGEE